MDRRGQSPFEIVAILGTVAVIVTLSLAGIRQYRPQDYALVIRQYNEVSRDLSWNAEKRLGGRSFGEILAHYRDKAVADARRMPEGQLAAASDPFRDLTRSVR